MDFSKYILIVVVLCYGCVVAKKFPSYIELCKRNDPQINACVIRAIEALRPHFRQGVPEFGIPPMDPLILPEATLDSGESFKATFKNIEIYYTDEFKLEHLNIDIEHDHLDLAMKLPRLRIKSQYNIDGKLLILTLKGNGPADGNFTDVSARLLYDGFRSKKNGKEYINVGNYTMELELNKPHFQFDNLFGDNTELNDQTNKIINENVEDIIVELQPVIRQVIGKFVIGIVNRVFNRFSFDELFPN